MSRARAAVRGLRRVVPAVLLVLGGTSCAYFNGIYNSREEMQKADRLVRRGNEEAARSGYMESAQKAESVLVRHRKSRWRTDALFLAGRGAALGGDCAHGEPRLHQYLATGKAAARERALAEVALGVCDVTAGRLREARERLTPLTTHKERDVSRVASLWAARVAMRLGDTDEALRLLSTVDAAAAQWELAMASLEVGAWARAESLLVERAARGDWRESALGAIDQLWAAGHDTTVLRLAERWARAKTPNVGKVRMHVRIGDLALGSGMDSVARRHFEAAMRISTEVAVDRESEARLLVIRVAQADSLEQVTRLIEDAQKRFGDDAVPRRLGSSLLLANLAIQRNGSFGSGWFLAAEVVRDSLRNARVAHSLFRKVTDSTDNSPLAPMALLAAALLREDSAEIYRERVRRQFADSPAAVILAGGDPASLPAWRFMEEEFRSKWTVVTKFHRDSIARMRPVAPTQDARLGQLP